MILASVKKKLRITVAVLETQAPLMESHRILAKYFADFIHLTFNKNYIHTGHPVRFENFLKELLDNHQMEQACIDRYLLSMNWKNTDTYICMTYQTSRWDKVGVVYYNVCTNLELQFPGSFAFYYDDAIIFLVNLTQQGLERQQLIYWLSSFLTEGVFRVGISYDFFEFHTFPSYYLQTLGALEMGTKYAPPMSGAMTFGIMYFITFSTMEPAGLTADICVSRALYSCIFMIQRIKRIYCIP